MSLHWLKIRRGAAARCIDSKPVGSATPLNAGWGAIKLLIVNSGPTSMGDANVYCKRHTAGHQGLQYIEPSFTMQYSKLLSREISAINCAPCFSPMFASVAT